MLPSRISASVNRPVAIWIFSITINIFFFVCEKDKRVTRSCGISTSSMHNGGCHVRPQTHPQVWQLHICSGLCQKGGADSLFMWVKAGQVSFPPRLTGCTLDVYQHLSDNEKADVGLTKASLYKAFAIDPCTASPVGWGCRIHCFSAEW